MYYCFCFVVLREKNRYIGQFSHISHRTMAYNVELNRRTHNKKLITCVYMYTHVPVVFFFKNTIIESLKIFWLSLLTFKSNFSTFTLHMFRSSPISFLSSILITITNPKSSLILAKQTSLPTLCQSLH